MKQSAITVVMWLFVMVFIYYFISHFILSIKTSVYEGDSINYHIPIAKNIINGNFIFQRNILAIEQWYPGSSEAILAFFILLGIPLSLFNILGILIFCLVLYKLGKIFLKDKVLAVIYSLSVVTTYGVFRLANTQNIDIWFAIYFLLLVILLSKSQNRNNYFLKLGFFSGMLIGSKYTGPLFLLVLLSFYFNSFTKYLNIKRLIIFVIPFSLLGLFWYARNLILTGSPVFPQTIMPFKGLQGWNSYLTIPMWKAYFRTPQLIVNANISELMIWPFIFILIVFVLIYIRKFRKDYILWEKIKKFIYISATCYILYLFFPYDNKYLGIVLSIRYIFAVFALLSLISFIIFQHFKQETVLSFILLLASLILFYNPYSPKISYVYCLPIFVGLELLINKEALMSRLSRRKRLKNN